MNYTALAKLAASARRNAHAPYSHFKVGAALLAASGKVYTGCNVEISTYALTVCGERTALFKAYSEGERKFKAIAVSTDTKSFTPPCGACRQVIMDLAGDIDIVMCKRGGGTRTLKLSRLFPLPFGARNLRERKKKSS